MLDLLHAYTTKLQRRTESVQSPRKNVREAWGQTSPTETKPDFPKHSSMDLSSVFEDNELQLVCSILETISLFTLCSCTPISKYLHDKATNKIKTYENDNNPHDIFPVPRAIATHRFVCIQCGRRLQILISDVDELRKKPSVCGKCKKHKEDLAAKPIAKMNQEARRMEERYKEVLEKELKPINRQMRLSLMQAGIVEAVSGWIRADYWIIQVFSTKLQYLLPMIVL